MTVQLTPVVIAIDDAVLHPEATHIAAATGRPIVEAVSSAELARHYSRAHAVFVDTARLEDLAGLPPRRGVFLLANDGDGDTEGAFVLPAQAADVLAALGRLHEAAPAVVTHGDGRVIAVVGAAGGAGASTLACAVARVAGYEAAPTVVDAHPFSGGTDLLLGIEDQVGVRWGDMDLGEGAVDPETLRRALPQTRDGIAVLTAARGGMELATAAAVERAVDVLGAEGLTVVDAPPAAIPQRCDFVAIVVPAEVRATAAAALIVEQCARSSIPCALVVRHRGWSGMDVRDIERAAKAECIAQLLTLPRLVKAVETSGLPSTLPRGLRRAAAAVVEQVWM
ncbi:septum site-determining protein Ssd [Corynebacterium aquatimens]|uniref:Secretion/DNA translocation related CpaE-like protein n=1 Tax=Corynebacterium aquatimens TaxID=1190508 RepID=A0A931E3J7_9CORY|nr:septum site-determining protein Ssd [Corynebacterium aquatimens]MBG6122531.1 secretion/DNA translocation related CpaE-like protein [Corynebacterium aquatimens]